VCHACLDTQWSTDRERDEAQLLGRGDAQAAFLSRRDRCACTGSARRSGDRLADMMVRGTDSGAGDPSPPRAGAHAKFFRGGRVSRRIVVAAAGDPRG
jgi:hypothetical protein